MALFGYPREEVIGRRLDEFVPPASQTAFAQRFSRFRERGVTHGSEVEMQRTDGEVMTISFDGVFVHDAQGRPAHTHCVLHNITERKRADAALRASAQHIRLLLDSTAEGLYGVDTQGNCVFVNRA